MSYSFKLTYTLLAETPIIHFQHAQSGAALRATEVKPKLDKYLKKRAAEKGLSTAAWKLTGQDALNYKMRITHKAPESTGGIVELGQKTDYDIFYGNMGSQMPKKGVKSDLVLEIICFISELRELIDAVIGDFFIVTNFGTMQDKGFGSFTVDGRDNSAAHIAECLRAEYSAEKCYTFDGGRAPFKRIKTVYALMKSGINVVRFDAGDMRVSDPGKYTRSMLFEFMHDEYDMGNDKAWLKQTGIGVAIGRQTAQLDAKPRYVRALLGVGDHIDFLRTLEKRTGKVNVKITSDAVKRFSSPILFKIIGGKVYYTARRLDDAIYGAAFTFSSQSCKAGKVLRVPEKEELGEDFIDRFLEYCLGRLNAALPKYNEKFTITEVQ